MQRWKTRWFEGLFVCWMVYLAKHFLTEVFCSTLCGGVLLSNFFYCSLDRISYCGGHCFASLTAEQLSFEKLATCTFHVLECKKVQKVSFFI